ncbi:MAG: hypothetical protein EAZ92_16490 [Candidatus Kapaibacterium sp.]|nr:MAG: hypothetical protein EAZ92_16490 [Candidatus Kapabacteria bacterium]
MFDQSILEKWLEERSNIALKKLVDHEPLTFEDNIVFSMVGLREEMRRMEKRMDERFERNESAMKELKQEVNDLRREMGDLRREVGDLRKEMIGMRQDITTLTRWILTVIVAVPVLMKLLDVIIAKVLH